MKKQNWLYKFVSRLCNRNKKQPARYRYRSRLLPLHTYNNYLILITSIFKLSLICL